MHKNIGNVHINENATYTIIKDFPTRDILSVTLERSYIDTGRIHFFIRSAR